jgi:TorA maturation chaperone TorD
MDIIDLIGYETARNGAYKGLAECYHQPTPQMGATLKDIERCLTALDSQAVSYISLMRREWLTLEKERDGLRVEYARLFIGPYSLAAPPYGSLYLDGRQQVMGPSTMDVTKRYSEAGLELAENFKDAPDHIAVELEFMHFLIYREMEAIHRDDRKGALENIELQKSFLENHLGAWASPFSIQLTENTCMTFYRHLAIATKKFLTEEMDALAAFTYPENATAASQMT